MCLHCMCNNHNYYFSAALNMEPFVYYAAMIKSTYDYIDDGFLTFIVFVSVPSSSLLTRSVF